MRPGDSKVSTARLGALRAGRRSHAAASRGRTFGATKEGRDPTILATRRHPPRAIARPAFTPRLGHAFRPHGFGSVRHEIPPSPHGYATTTPLRPFGRLARRHHGIYHQGWYFPTTIGDDIGYIGVPYDPGETIPVYGPAPIYDDPADPPARRRVPAAAARAIDAGDDNRDACRAEMVTVPARDGEREIRVVRC